MNEVREAYRLLVIGLEEDPVEVLFPIPQLPLVEEQLKDFDISNDLEEARIARIICIEVDPPKLNVPSPFSLNSRDPEKDREALVKTKEEKKKQWKPRKKRKKRRK